MTKQKIGILVLGSILIVIFVFQIFASKQEHAQNVPSMETVDSSIKSSEGRTVAITNFKEPATTIIVDIKGAVHKPGVYKMQGDVRLCDVIAEAQGLKEAEESKLPLALKITDQATITIPKKGDMTDQIVQKPLKDTPSKETTTETSKIAINQASAEEIQKLDGVGQKKADAIIKYRNEHGPFHSLDDLKQIRGVGDKTIENWKDQLIF